MRGNSGSFLFSFRGASSVVSEIQQFFESPASASTANFSKGEMKRAQRDAICPSATMRLGKFSVSADYAGFCSRLHGFRPESRRYERRNSMRACRRASSLIVRPDSILRSSSPCAPQSFFTFLSSSSIKFYSYQFSSCRSSDLR